MAKLHIAIDVSGSGTQLKRRLQRIEKAITSSDRVVERVAFQSLARVKSETPRKYGLGEGGHTRDQWEHTKLANLVHVVRNPSKIMRFLEFGTKSHGPKTAKALFIPLRRRAAEEGPKAVMEANARARAQNVWRDYGNRVMGKRGRKPNLPFKPGRDFIFTKWVKGIKAMRIASKEQKRAGKRLREGLVTHLTNALRK